MVHTSDYLHASYKPGLLFVFNVKKASLNSFSVNPTLHGVGRAKKLLKRLYFDL